MEKYLLHSRRAVVYVSERLQTLHVRPSGTPGRHGRGHENC